MSAIFVFLKGLFLIILRDVFFAQIVFLCFFYAVKERQGVIILTTHSASLIRFALSRKRSA